METGPTLMPSRPPDIGNGRSETPTGGNPAKVGTAPAAPPSTSLDLAAA